MRKLIWLALLLPTMVNAQVWVNGSIQRESTSGWWRGLQGANNARLALYSDLPSGTNFIENQTASAQTAGYWINGSAIFGTNPSMFGAIRLPNNTGIFWRNAANTNNIGLTLSSSDVLTTSANISVGSVTTSTFSSSIAKTNGSGTLVAAVANTDYLPVNNAALTGTPTAPTALPLTGNTQIATTKYVDDAVTASGGSLWTRSSGILSPTTPNDRISASSNTAYTIFASSSGSGGLAFSGLSSAGPGAQFESSSSGNAGLIAKNSSSGNIQNWLNNTAQVGNMSNAGVLTSRRMAQSWVATGANADSILAHDNSTKQFVAKGVTGTGNVVQATSPTLVTPTLGAASGTSLNLSGLTASSAVATDGSKNLVSVTNTGTGNNVLATSPTLVTPNIGVATGTSLAATGGAYFMGQLAPISGSSLELGYATGAGRISSYDRTGGVAMPLILTGSTYTLSGLGSGSVISSSGVLSVSSDSRIKDLNGEFKGSALKAILSIEKPQYWNYSEKSKFPLEARKVKQFGLLADKVHPVLGEEFAPTQKDGTYSMNDRAILGLVVQALQEANEKITNLENEIKLLKQ